MTPRYVRVMQERNKTPPPPEFDYDSHPTGWTLSCGRRATSFEFAAIEAFVAHRDAISAEEWRVYRAHLRACLHIHVYSFLQFLLQTGEKLAFIYFPWVVFFAHVLLEPSRILLEFEFVCISFGCAANLVQRKFFLASHFIHVLNVCVPLFVVLFVNFIMLSCIFCLMSLSSILASRFVGVLQNKVLLSSNIRRVGFRSSAFYLVSFHVSFFLCIAIAFSWVAYLKNKKTLLAHSLMSIKNSYTKLF